VSHESSYERALSAASGILARMSMLDMYRSDLRRAREAAAKDRRTVADLSGKIVTKSSELSRTKSESRIRSLLRDIENLEKARATAEKSLATREKKVADLVAKVEARDAAERKKSADAQARRQRELDHQLRQAEAQARDFSDRLSAIESTQLEQVHEAVASDPVEREHDVFLSHTSDPADVEVSDELFKELTARDLDVWYDGAEIELGKSLVRQIDRGIAKSKCGVILITEAFLKGRIWTEREMATLVNTGRRVIPILDGVSYEALEAYSPILGERVGLDTERFTMGQIAEQIGVTIQAD
jgi:hypothetical protein